MQPQLTPGVEVVTMTDQGQLSIGAKRQRMIEESPAQWVSFVDDDDMVPGDYCRRIWAAMKADIDVVGFRLRYFVDAKQEGTAVHSFGAPKIGKPSGPDWWAKYDRTPNHLNPTRRTFALKAGYKPLNFGEDGDYARRLAKLNPRPREKFLDWFGYDYLFVPQKVYEHLKTKTA